MRVSQRVIAARLPFLETRHPLPVGKIAVDCKCQLTAALLMARFGFRVSEIIGMELHSQHIIKIRTIVYKIATLGDLENFRAAKSS